MGSSQFHFFQMNLLTFTRHIRRSLYKVCSCFCWETAVTLTKGTLSGFLSRTSLAKFRMRKCVLTMNACPPWHRAKRPAISNTFLLMLADQECARNMPVCLIRRESPSKILQGEPNVLGKPQNHVCSHFWSHVNKLISSTKNFKKNVSFFDAIFFQTRPVWEGALSSTGAPYLSRNNSNFRKNVLFRRREIQKFLLLFHLPAKGCSKS